MRMQLTEVRLIHDPNDQQDWSVRYALLMQAQVLFQIGPRVILLRAWPA